MSRVSILVVLIIVLVTFSHAKQPQSANKMNQSADGIVKHLTAFLDFCDIKSAIQGFFTGCEPDPDVANSKCVTYYPSLEVQVALLIEGFNMSLVIPTNFIGYVDHSATLINRYALWQEYCVFGELFTKLDNTIETFSGITTLAYKFILNYAQILVQVGDLTTKFQDGECFDMFKALGIIFHILFEYEIPEDIV